MALQGDVQNNRIDAKDDPGFTAAPRDYRSWAGDLFLDQPFGRNWAVTGEGAWIARRDDYTDTALDPRTIRGYYAQSGLLLPPTVGPGRLQLVGRYESWDMQRGAAVVENRNRAVGLTYFVKDHDRKIQLDYTQKHERPVALDNDEIRLSIIAVF